MEELKQQIRRRLDRPEYARFFAAVRKRLEGAGAQAARSMALVGFAVEERTAIADLHGWRSVPGEGERIGLAALDEALRQSAMGATLVEVVEALAGEPLANRREERGRALADRERLWAEAMEQVEGRLELVRWLEDLRATGLLSRCAKAERCEEAALLRCAVAAARRLPAQGVLLSVFATEVTGNAHGLDRGRALSALVLKAAAYLGGWAEVPPGAAGRRQVWAAMGVYSDVLSNDVLTLGLQPLGNGLLARHLRESSAAGEPRRVTLRELQNADNIHVSDTTVFVCENPSVVAAAANALASQSAPLVCVDGVPSTAAIELLLRLRKGGAALVFHADFDWAGIRIGNLLRQRLQAAPWRFGTADYLAGLTEVSDDLPLVKASPDASWDPALVPAMRKAGRALFEEQVMDVLIDDLTR